MTVSGQKNNLEITLELIVYDKGTQVDPQIGLLH